MKAFTNISFEGYQKMTRATAVYPDSKAIEYLSLGLASEAGEVAGKIKKIIRGDKPLNAEAKKEIVYEIGDVLWYIARLADELNFDLEQVACINLNKLFDRKARNTIKGDGDER